MVASKKKTTKKASTKKASTKKGPASQRIEFALDAERVAAIKRCLAKGTLRVTVNKADLARGRIRGPWLYD